MQLGPLNPKAHRHVKLDSVTLSSMQMPPFRHGCKTHMETKSSQVLPVYLEEHLQMKSVADPLVMMFSQEPPLRQGRVMVQVLEISQFSPRYVLLHMH